MQLNGFAGERSLPESASSPAVGMGRTRVVNFVAVGAAVAEGAAFGDPWPQPASHINRSKAATDGQVRTLPLASPERFIALTVSLESTRTVRASVTRKHSRRVALAQIPSQPRR